MAPATDVEICISSPEDMSALVMRLASICVFITVYVPSATLMVDVMVVAEASLGTSSSWRNFQRKHHTESGSHDLACPDAEGE